MVWRIKNRHTFKVCWFKNRQYSKSMPILNSAYFTAWYDDMTSAFGKVCRIKNRHTFKSMPILNSAYFTECRFVIRHITQTETQTETELLRRHSMIIFKPCSHVTFFKNGPFFFSIVSMKNGKNGSSPIFCFLACHYLHNVKQKQPVLIKRAKIC